MDKVSKDGNMNVPDHNRVSRAALNSVPVNEKIYTKKTCSLHLVVPYATRKQQTNIHSLAPEGYKSLTGPTSALQQRPSVPASQSTNPHNSVKMFFRASTLLLPVIALSSVVAAAPEPITARTGSSCSNGTLQCCGSTYKASYLILFISETAVNQLLVHS